MKKNWDTGKKKEPLNATLIFEKQKHLFLGRVVRELVRARLFV
jgi:hypothetical protein